MDFKLVAKTASALSAPFGLAFLFAPAATAAAYGVQASDAALILVGRYFGVAMLMYAAAAWSLAGLTADTAQRRASSGLALATGCGLVVSLMGVSAGTINTMGWGSVALYGAFTLAWSLAAWRGGSPLRT